MRIEICLSPREVIVLNEALDRVREAPEELIPAVCQSLDTGQEG